MSSLPASVGETLALLRRGNYVGDRSLATAVYLALTLNRPLFLEGEAGVGKTEIAKVLSETLGRKLIRLQCYEGLDVASAVYEWNYARQMIEIRLAESGSESRDTIEEEIFSDRFLIKRPLLQALEPDLAGPPVLLIDELDRTDEPFEAYLLEVLSDFQITIPELGTIKAEKPPIVVITSNRTREIHDALKRRCFYFWVDYPSAERELEILRVGRRALPRRCRARSWPSCRSCRQSSDLFKLPGVAETIDWAHALTQLDVLALSPEAINDTLGVLLKYQDDIAEDPRVARPSACSRQVKQELAAAQMRRQPSAPRSGRLSTTSCISRARCAPRDCRSGPGKVLAAVEAVRAVGIADRARFLLDAPRRLRQPPRPARALRPGLPHLLAQSAAPREDDGADAAECCARTRPGRGDEPPPRRGAAPRRPAPARTGRPRRRSSSTPP